VVYFGIEGDHCSTLSKYFDLPEAWSNSGYTKHEYETTYTAIGYIGVKVMEQQYSKQYSKSNLLLAAGSHTRSVDGPHGEAIAPIHRRTRWRSRWR
jgi:hypothetical protein